MEQKFNYIGCFFSREELYRQVEGFAPRRLSRPIEHPHVTFVYRPGPVDPRLIGLPVRARAVGYGNDGRNEGLRVELLVRDEALRQLADAIPVPHITLSVGPEGRPVDTAGLTFAPVEPFEITGVFGGFCPGTGPVLALR